MRVFIPLLGAIALLSLPAMGHAAAEFGAATDFNVFSLGAATPSNTEVTGRMAAGGDVLVAGGARSLTNDQANHADGVGIKGSVPAPDASTAFNKGHIGGRPVAGALFGNGEPHNVLFQGQLPPSGPPPGGAIPEPGSMVLLAGAVLPSLPLFLRRKRA